MPIPTGDDMIRQAVSPILPRKSSKKSAEPEADDKSKTGEKGSEKSSDKDEAKRGPKEKNSSSIMTKTPTSS